MGLNATNLWMVAKISFNKASSNLQGSFDLHQHFQNLSSAIESWDNIIQKRYWLIDYDDNSICIIWGNYDEIQ